MKRVRDLLQGHADLVSELWANYGVCNLLLLIQLLGANTYKEHSYFKEGYLKEVKQLYEKY